tara:strand:+ start:1190 stop:1768 length:579 start_codon:yes stop_codon:yes gene_type:complete
MWAKLNSDKDTVEEVIVNMQPMVIDNITHPKALFTLWTDAERLAVGIVPVTTTGTHLDTAYYIEADPTYAIAGNKKSVIRTIGVKSADKSLSDLKSDAKNKANSAAHNLLKGYSWLIERKVTADTDIPSAVITFFSNIRTDHKNICDDVDNASDMAAFIVLHTTTYKDDGTVNVIARVSRWTSDENISVYRR